MNGELIWETFFSQLLYICIEYASTYICIEYASMYICIEYDSTYICIEYVYTDIRTSMGVVVRRYIDFLILLIRTLLVSALFCNIPTFCSFFKMFFVL